MEQKGVLLEVKHIYKSFSGVPVLRDLGFAIKKGEIHALMGENGAGKSTVIKIITGVYTKDSGEIVYEGREVPINSRSDAAKLGISTIFQELSLIPTLTVAENIFLGRERTGPFGAIRKKERQKLVEELIAAYDFPGGDLKSAVRGCLADDYGRTYGIPDDHGEPAPVSDHPGAGCKGSQYPLHFPPHGGGVSAVRHHHGAAGRLQGGDLRQG